MRLPTNRFSTRAVARATCSPPKPNRLPPLTRPVIQPRNPMLHSVRVRLPLWHVGVVACVLLILAGATIFLLQRNSLRRIDNSLEDVGSAFLATVRAELHDPDSSGHFKDSVAAAIQEHTY